jgi:hypothetical protein
MASHDINGQQNWSLSYEVLPLSWSWSEEDSRGPSFDSMVRKLKRHFGGDNDADLYE